MNKGFVLWLKEEKPSMYLIYIKNTQGKYLNVNEIDELSYTSRSWRLQNEAK